MQMNHELTGLEKEMDNIIVKILLPITDELKSKTKEIKQKRLELKKEMYNIKQLKQSLLEKRKKLNKQKKIYDNNLNGDFSNVKLCKECLTTYINLIDKKQTDFLKDKEDFYELKLRQKELEFNNQLIEIIKEKNGANNKKRIHTKLSFDAPKRLNISSHSIAKNLNNSFKSDNKDTIKNKNKNKTVSPKKVVKSDKSKKYIKKDNYNKDNKDKSVNRNLKRKNSNESKENKSIEKQNKKNLKNLKNQDNDVIDKSEEIEKLIKNYSSKKKETNTYKSEDFNDGLTQLKEINKDMKVIENGLKEMVIDN